MYEKAMRNFVQLKAKGHAVAAPEHGFPDVERKRLVPPLLGAWRPPARQVIPRRKI
jgi:hypothetical protein